MLGLAIPVFAHPVSFASPSVFPVGQLPAAVATGDLNHDGQVDRGPDRSVWRPAEVGGNSRNACRHGIGDRDPHLRSEFQVHFHFGSGARACREYRDAATSEERRVNIRRQTRIFRRRLHLGSWGARVLYSGAGCFAIVALLIGLSVSGKILPQAILVLFLIGLALIVVAIVLQLLELQQSNRTVDRESSEILGPAKAG